MATKLKVVSQEPVAQTQGAEEYIIGIVVSEYNTDITSALQKGCVDTLIAHGVDPENIEIVAAPGAFELPLAAQMLHESSLCDAVIVLGCVIKGDTDHDIYINHAVSKGLMDLSLDYGVPFIFGLLTTNTLEQAQDRAGGKLGNKGQECAIAAIKMIELKNSLDLDSEEDDDYTSLN